VASPKKDRGRVIVGVTDSLTGLRAIREAVAQARHRRTQLIAVRTFREPKPLITPVRDVIVTAELYGFSGEKGESELDRQWQRAGRNAVAEIRQAFSDALGSMPRDIPVETSTDAGRLVPAVRAIACHEEDLIVLPVEKIWLRKAIRAECPVLLVPPHEFARTFRRHRRTERMTVQAFLPETEKTGFQ
jgi:nucleotide-binding universal stress UspA family protein